jgi:hypothetical protein
MIGDARAHASAADDDDVSGTLHLCKRLFTKARSVTRSVSVIGRPQHVRPVP